MAKRPIKIHQSLPRPSGRGMAIVPIGLLCNQALQNASVGDTAVFCVGEMRHKRIIANICRFRINTPEFTFMLRSIYGEGMTIAKLFERWEAWAVVEGIGKDGFSRDYAILVEVKDCLE